MERWLDRRQYWRQRRGQRLKWQLQRELNGRLYAGCGRRLGRLGRVHRWTSYAKFERFAGIQALTVGIAVQPGKSPFDAMQVFLDGKTEANFDCTTGTQIVQMLALAKDLGKVKFDELFNAKNPLVLAGVSACSSRFTQGPAQGVMKTDLIPGDYRRFTIPNPKDRRNLETENAIYIGNSDYYAHPFGILSKTALNQLMDNARIQQTNPPNQDWENPISYWLTIPPKPM